MDASAKELARDPPDCSHDRPYRLDAAGAAGGEVVVVAGRVRVDRANRAPESARRRGRRRSRPRRGPRGRGKGAILRDGSALPSPPDTAFRWGISPRETRPRRTAATVLWSQPARAATRRSDQSGRSPAGWRRSAAALAARGISPPCGGGAFSAPTASASVPRRGSALRRFPRTPNSRRRGVGQVRNLPVGERFALQQFRNDAIKQRLVPAKDAQGLLHGLESLVPVVGADRQVGRRHAVGPVAPQSSMMHSVPHPDSRASARRPCRRRQTSSRARPRHRQSQVRRDARTNARRPHDVPEPRLSSGSPDSFR